MIRIYDKYSKTLNAAQTNLVVAFLNINKRRSQHVWLDVLVQNFNNALQTFKSLEIRKWKIFSAIDLHRNNFYFYVLVIIENTLTTQCLCFFEQSVRVQYPDDNGSFSKVN